MKFNGSAKQQKWAAQIVESANLNETQIDNLLKWAGPTQYAQGIMQSSMIITYRDNLAKMADSLPELYKKNGVA